ncbi:MAG: rhodanese-like domain-containing protein [Methylococcaceae bacterium]|nr:rhodanese-like domain-containing protein [Methylococcaceae bacterium]
MAMTAMEMVAAAKQQIQEVDISTAKTWLGQTLVLDVREPAEYAAGCLPGAVNIPRGVLEFKIEAHPAFQGKQGADILVYCQSGGRSALAVETLQKLGWGKPVSLAGGFNAWQQNGGPVVTPA